MLSLVQSWFTEGANPVGVDFGTECLRLAQVEMTGGEYRLIAAASAQVPAKIRDDGAGRLAFLAKALRDLWIDGNFRGRKAVLALPAASLHIQHLRLPKMDEESLRKSIPWETQGKLPIDASTALIRHLVAGDVYDVQEPRSEVIVFAASRQSVNQLLAAADMARLNVVGMMVGPQALIGCLTEVYRRKGDSEVTNCFLDIGSASSRAMVARGGHLLFARTLPLGGTDFVHAEHANPVPSPLYAGERDKVRGDASSCATHDNGPSPQPSPPSTGEREQTLIETGGVAAIQPPIVGSIARLARDGPAANARIEQTLPRLIEELDRCRRYHDATFPARPVQRLIFAGGAARQRDVCERIARGLGLAAQIGDPLVRMGRTTEVGIESGIDRRLPQPAWAVAIGLSMGSPGSNAR